MEEVAVLPCVDRVARVACLNVVQQLLPFRVRVGVGVADDGVGDPHGDGPRPDDQPGDQVRPEHRREEPDRQRAEHRAVIHAGHVVDLKKGKNKFISIFQGRNLLLSKS